MKQQGIAALIAVAALVTAGCAEMNPFQRDDDTRARDTGGTAQQTGMQTQKSFSQIDKDGDNNISRTEAEEAGLDQLVDNWQRADKDADNVLDQGEFSAFTQEQ